MKDTNPSKPTPMDKKATDRAISRWVLSCLFGPTSLLSALAFVTGYWFPDSMAATQPTAQWLGLHHLVAIRTVGAEFDPAAYLYWLTFWVTLPFNLAWLYRRAVKQNLSMALHEVARVNLKSGAWDPKKYTLHGGQVRFFLLVILTVSLLLVQLVSAREPTYCKGCETTSVLGFVLVNWLGTHLMLIAGYYACSYFVLWKSIRTNFGEE